MFGEFFDSYDYDKIYFNFGICYDFFFGGVEVVCECCIIDFFGNI